MNLITRPYKRHFIHSSITVILFSVLLAGCKGNSSGPDDSNTVSRIEIQSDQTDLWLDDSLQLKANLLSSKGDLLPTQPIQWSSTDPGILEINQTGLIRAKQTGTAEIVARYENLSDTLLFSIYTYALVYESVVEDYPALYLLKLDENATPQLLPGLRQFSYEPAASNDGNFIVYTALDLEAFNYDLWLYDVQNQSSTRLTTHPEIDDMASWSPDGLKIAFRSDRQMRGGDILIYNLAEKTVTNLTDVPGVAIEDRQPSWSPDGSQIVYSSNESGRMNIWLMNPDGSEKRQIRFTQEYDTEAAWSPDGKKIIYRTNFEDGFDFTVYDVEAETYDRMEIPGYEFMPAWSPDGRWLAYVHRNQLNDRPEIYMMRPDGSDSRRLTPDEWTGGQNPTFLRVQ